MLTDFKTDGYSLQILEVILLNERSSFQRNVQFVAGSYPGLYYCADLNGCIDDLSETGLSPW